MKKDDVMILAQFFVIEFSVDASSVADWLDNEQFFADEEDRDAFIERIKVYVEELK
jgi:hypothetical protein